MVTGMFDETSEKLKKTTRLQPAIHVMHCHWLRKLKHKDQAKSQFQMVFFFFFFNF